jgi:predicted solute-binding protein
MLQLSQALVEMVFSVMLYNTKKTSDLDSFHASVQHYIQCLRAAAKEGLIKEEHIDSYYAFVGHAYSFLDI